METYTHSIECRVTECSNPAEHILKTDAVGILVEACWECAENKGWLIVADIEDDGIYIVEPKEFDKGRRITEALRARLVR